MDEKRERNTFLISNNGIVLSIGLIVLKDVILWRKKMSFNLLAGGRFIGPVCVQCPVIVQCVYSALKVRSAVWCTVSVQISAVLCTATYAVETGSRELAPHQTPVSHSVYILSSGFYTTSERHSQ